MATPASGEKATVPHAFPDVLYEDNHLLVVDKPAGMPAQPDDSGDPALDGVMREYLRRKYNKPGDAYLGLVHRLDRPTSGAVVLAKTGKAAARMSDLFRRRAIGKTYLALVHLLAEPENEALLHDVLVPQKNGGMRLAAAGQEKKGGKEAELSYRTIVAAGDRALLLVRLWTGVKHQIRCQLAARGLPVLGDFRYGPFGKTARPEPVEGGRAILLHAARLEFGHPVRKVPLTVTAPIPAYWRPFLVTLPGWENWDE